MKIVSWNVNSLRVRLPHVTAWAGEYAPDILCLQETKLTDEDFPHAEFHQAGYQCVCAGQKTYNGVATISRGALNDVQAGLPDMEDGQKRLLAATYNDIRIVNIYVPNGQTVGSDKYAYKLAWLQALLSYIEAQRRRYDKMIVLGDFNIAPQDADVHDPAAWVGSVMVSEDERRAFRGLLDLGLVDLYRQLHPTEQEYSWWDYRAGSFRRNRGLRIDHILCTPAVAALGSACYIDKAPRKLERPSDHAPVVAHFPS